jgi:hypothetical protein
MSPERARTAPHRRAALFILMAGLFAELGCGKKGPPLPPLRRGPEHITALSVRQEGKAVVLTGLLPEKSQDGGPLAPLAEVRIFRLDRGGLSGVPGGNARSFQRAAMKQFTKESRRIASVSGEALAQSRSGRRFTFVDTEPLAGSIPDAGKDLTYAMTAMDAEKRSSPLSSFAAIRIFPPPLPPGNLKAEISEKSIHLTGEPPPPQSQKEAPSYNVYRSVGKEPFPDRPRNDKPLSQPVFEETEFAFGREYGYVVRSVLISGAASRESENSETLALNPVDVYAPSTPTGFAVSAEGSEMKLYWFPNGESDLAGYKVYRSESESEGFVEITSLAATETTYVDKGVQPGIRYFYCISAFDSANPPNESSRSEVRGDRLPPAGAPGGTKPKKS